MKVSAVALALVISLPLVACSRSLAAPEQQAPIADLNALQVKAGLWRHTMVIDGRQGSGEECDTGRPLIPPNRGDCSKYEVVLNGAGQIVFDSICGRGPATLTSHAAYSGDLNSSFANDVVVDVEDPSRGSTRITGRETYEYLGPCPAGMKPQG